MSQSQFNQVFLTQRVTLLRTLQRMVNNPSTAEDLLQETYLRVTRALNERSVEHLEPFVYQTARNLALDHCRRQAVESTYRIYTEDGELPQVAGGCVPERCLHERQVLDAIDAVLGILPFRTRHAFELYRLGGLTQRDIAQQLGCSATLVNFMLRDATQAVASCRDLLDGA